MTPTRGVALLLAGVCLTGVLVRAAGRDAAPASGAAAAAASSIDQVAHLQTISSKTGRGGTSLAITLSEPVPYVATRPDPRTLLIDFRHVDASAVTRALGADARSPIEAVAVEPSTALGADGSRVHVTLSQPVAHHVRSERGTIYVDFDRPSPKGTPYVTPPAAQQADGGSASLAASAADPIEALGLNSPDPQARRRRQAAAPPGPAPAPAAPAAPDPAPADQAAQTPQAQPPTPAPQDQTMARGAERKFTGHPVSLDFQGADLRAVLRTFSEISGLNIVIDPAVQGTVDVALRDVPWDQALDIILRANKLGYLVDGTIVRIAPLAVLADEEAQRRKLADEQALSGELRVLTKSVSYARAEELKDLLTKSTLSQRGSVQVDPRTNTLIITDLPDRLATANELISTLDKPQPQVEIEARIVQTTKNYARELGIQWGFNGQVSPALGNTTNLAFPNSGSVTGRTGPSQGPAGQPALPNAVNLGVKAPNSAVGLQLGSVNGAFNLDVALSALETSGNGRLLSTPRVSTQNNVEAEITQGVQIPIQTVANNTVTVTFKDAALTLKVTPQITAANTVIMKISVENASPDFSRAVNNIPPINTQRANTQVLVTDGQTTVIGGIYVSQEQAATDRTPGISRIPLLGWLFRHDSVNDQSTELLIFITPRIIKV